MTTTVQKILRLRLWDNLALFKWTVGNKRIAKNFMFLSDVRLNILACERGVVTLSVAAPFLFLDKNRQHLRFQSSGMFTITEGEVWNVNMPLDLLKGATKVVPTKHITETCLEGDLEEQPKRIQQLITKLGDTSSIPVSKLVFPEVYRIFREATTVTPVYTKDMIRALSSSPIMSIQELHDNFVAHIDRFATKVEGGWCIPNDLVVSGGVAVVPKHGFSNRGGSEVYQMPLNMLRNELALRKWQIKLGAEI